MSQAELIPARQSERLRAFYRTFLAWASKGCPDDDQRTDLNPHGFDMRQALCGNLKWFAFHEYGYADYPALDAEMKAQFKAAGLGVSFPFNKSDIEYVNERSDPYGRFKNKARWQWLLAHAKM